MIPTLESIFDENLRNWLLEPENPSIRYLTLRNLLDCKDNDPRVLEAKSTISSSNEISRIFSKQSLEGYWEDPDNPYLPKYRSTYWQIMILSQLGLDRSHERIEKACEFISRFQLEDGGFTTDSPKTATERYRWKKRQLLKKGKSPPALGLFVANTIKEGELSCLTGNIATALIRLGYNDKHVKDSLDWLIEVQNKDGGWLCPYWKAHIRDKHGCFMGTIPSLDALSHLPPSMATTETEEAARKGAEFLLIHRLFKADHHGFNIINETWLRLGFPSFFYDILRGLEVVTRLGYARDIRIDDALQILLSKRGSDGRWVLESTPSGRMHIDLERKGEPSKWVTLRVLNVFRGINEARGQSERGPE